MKIFNGNIWDAWECPKCHELTWPKITENGDYECPYCGVIRKKTRQV